MTTNNNTMNNNTMDMQVYALANMVYNGKGFCVVQKHDGNGGYFHEIEPLNYETRDFEYIEWSGTPMQFAKDCPSFTTHIEPFHSKPMDFPYTALEMLQWVLHSVI